MTTKFNKDMYARMRGAPILSALSSTPTLGMVGIALLTTLLKELTPRHKRPRTGDKQKEKVDSRSSRVWDDAGVALVRAQDVFGANDMKVFSEVSTNEVVQLHKFV